MWILSEVHLRDSVSHVEDVAWTCDDDPCCVGGFVVTVEVINGFKMRRRGRGLSQCFSICPRTHRSL